MSDIVRFAVLGLGLGATYAMSAIGIVLIYRGSGVINFAQGAIGAVAAYLAWELQQNHGWPFFGAFLAGVSIAALLGMATQFMIMRPLGRASWLARLIATLGVLVILQSALVLRYGAEVTLVPSPFPSRLIYLFGGDVLINEDRLWLLAVSIIVTTLLWGLYRWTRFGRATTAVAENPIATAALGWSTNLIAMVNWGLGGALAGAAGILITPIVGLQVAALTNVLLAALAAALVGGFVSFPATLAAALFIGVAKSELTRFSTRPGLADSLPIFVILVMVVLSGRALPIRGTFYERLPKLGTGRVHPGLVATAVLFAFVFTALIASDAWADTVTTTLGVAMIVLSAVVVTGYAGQISLAQFAFAGLGAFIAGRLVATTNVPFVAALLIGVAGAVPVGLLFAIPAVRTRGVKLAIITLGLATAMFELVFANPKYTGGLLGTNVGEADLFGLDIGGVEHPGRYGAFVLALFTFTAVAVTNLRRGRAGRRLIAVRINERAAASLGINPWTVKLYAFGLSAAIAALGGILIAFRSSAIVYEQFLPFESIVVLSSAVIGGIGYVMGSVVGAMFLPGSIGAKIIDEVFGFPPEWLPLISGTFVIFLLLRHQDGVADTITRAVHAIGARQAARPRRHVHEPQPLARTLNASRRESEGTAVRELDPVTISARSTRRHRVSPRCLELRNVSVTYGGVAALRNVSVSIEPGQIVGLIGPNGAGKTTLVDAASGFVRYTGHVFLDDQPIDHMRPHQRARAGMVRSFQSLEIFEDLTVGDNLRTASDPGGAVPYFRDIFYPKHLPLSDAALACIEEFNIAPLLDQFPTELSYGQRRLVAIARAVATAPSVLLLDEPAAGLVEWSAEELAKLVKRLANDWGMAILVIEHDIRFIMTACDSVMALNFGEAIAWGRPEVVRHTPAVVAAYLGDVGQIRRVAASTRARVSSDPKCEEDDRYLKHATAQSFPTRPTQTQRDGS